MPAKFTNNATATLAASLSTSSTSITVTTGQGALFPTLSTGDYFYATLTNSSNNIEIVKITSRSSDTLTAVRAQEGTTALTWNAADKLELRVTSAVLTNFAQQDSPNTFAGAMTYGGVTLSNAVTGTGAMVLSASPALTGVPTAPTAAAGTSTTQLATTAFANAAFQGAYPVGSIYMNASSSTNPATLFGFGTWVAFGAGRVLIGLDSGNALFNTAGNTGGSADAIVVSHTHTVTDPGHAHLWGTPNSVYGAGGGSYSWGAQGNNTPQYNTNTVTTGVSVNSTGASGTNANYQPYITVYMWQRTA